ncbi:DUF2169 domain-containing protein [Aureliella helgolandensis]|uniref:Secreted effector protein pipB2 n=1 Tax=Aureliella helgolandensis TaxID=2527968 RepID=A0A518GAJ2_9BACT|nr:DUF2169 domain-containing protein [Aureliella helgolandensis]QDV25616.1 Secreted effector protein pipB2 [Aureliella helgolandensis]
MRVICEETIRAGWFAHSFNPPDLAGVFVAKLSCKLQPNGVATLLEGDDVVELSGDLPLADDPANPLKYSSDFVPYKPRFDLLLQATAYSPTGQPASGWQTRWQIGEWSKTLQVFGERRWISGPFSSKIGPPQPIVSLPLDYRLAFGGADADLNPLGQGYGWKAELLPCIEDPTRLVKSPDDKLEPAGMGPISGDWPVRRAHVGTYDEQWQRTRWPWFPSDFDYAYFNAAPRDQQLETGLNGHEELTFENLHCEHAHYRTRLPQVRVRCFLSASTMDHAELSASDFHEVPLQFDTLQIDLEAEVATLLFRGHTAIQSLKMSEIQTVFWMTESTSGAPLTSSDCMARFRTLLQADEEAPPDPVELAEEEAAQQKFATQMEALEAEYAVAMQEAEKEIAQARERALAAGVDASKFDSPNSSSLAELKQQMAAMAEGMRVQQPDVAMQLDAQILEIDQLATVEAEMQAESGDRLTRADVERMAAAGESFRGRSLADLELYDMKLSGLDFSDVDFTDCMLDGADLSGSNLTNAKFSEADLSQANLSGACLDYADFSEAVVEACDFRGTSLEGTVFSELDLTHADFSGASGRGPDFSSAKLNSANFCDAKLPQADFSEADVSHARFDRAELQAASFEGVTAKNVRMPHADLTGLHASDQADFADSDFSCCMAEGAIWEEATLDGCDFRESKSPNAIFTQASLVGCRFDRSDLRDSTFEDAILTNAILDQCNLMRASFDRAQLTDASMREANIYRAGFWNAAVTGLDRRGTSEIGTVLPS